MKIAICLSGLTRDHENSLNSIKQYFSEYEVDVYCQAYSIKDVSSALKSINNTRDTIEYYKNNCNTDQIIELYNPINRVIIPYETISNSFDQLFIEIMTMPGIQTANNKSNPNVISMHFGLHLINQMLKESKTDYDFVIRMRYDSLIVSMPPLRWFNKTKIYIPSGKDWDGINDQFAFGAPALMEKYLSVFDNLIPLCEKYKVYHPEKFVQYNLIERGIIDLLERPSIDVLIGHEVRGNIP